MEISTKMEKEPFNLKKKSPRLYDVSLMVDKDCYLADIGTDHGYLPIYLIQSNIIKRAIAADVANGPLNKAIDNIKLAHLEDKITTILSNGFNSLPNEIEEAVLAGMGQHLIAEIISNMKQKNVTLILQANDDNLEFLRTYLVNNGYMIIDEKVTIEKISSSKTRYYEILKVKKGYQKLTEDELLFGPINLKRKDELFLTKWNDTIERYNAILNSFKGSEEQRKEKEDIINKIKKVIG